MAYRPDLVDWLVGYGQDFRSFKESLWTFIVFSQSQTVVVFKMTQRLEEPIRVDHATTAIEIGQAWVTSSILPTK